MIKNDYSLASRVNSEVTSNIVGKGTRDLIVLRYMAKQIHRVLHTLEQPSVEPIPLRYSLEVRNHRQQRVIMYNPQFLLQNKTLSFVGFVSEVRKVVDPSIDYAMQKIDTLLIKELINTSGLLCYSSLELCPDKWYNLVLLANFNIKTHLQNSATHCHGAYQLAPHYYEWIRIHKGIIPDGLARNTLLLQKTNYYTYQATEQRFSIQEYKHRQMSPEFDIA